MYTVSLNYYNLFVIQNIAVLARNPSFKLNLSMIMPPNFLFHDCDVQQGGSNNDIKLYQLLLITKLTFQLKQKSTLTLNIVNSLHVI